MSTRGRRTPAYPPGVSSERVAAGFVLDRHAVRVIGGAGVRHRIAGEIARLGARVVALVPSGSLEAEAAAIAEGLGVDTVTITGARPHVEADRAADAAAAARSAGAEAILSIGGGSATGLAKPVAAALAVPLIAVPTTFAGSEATATYGLTREGVKRTTVDPRARPTTVVLDPELTLGLPGPVAAASALNALAHCVEGLWGPGANPVSAAVGEAAARLLAEGLRAMAADPADVGPRERLLVGGLLAGVVFDECGAGVHHHLCHVLGGAYGLDHAGTHAALIPHVAARLAAADPAGTRRLAAAIGAADLGRGLDDLGRSGGAGMTLALPPGRRDEAVALCMEAAPPRPWPPGPALVGGLIDAAVRGERPPPDVV